MRTRYKKLFGILLSLVLVVGMLPAWSMTVHADDKPAVKYLDESGVEKYCTDYTIVTQGMDTHWNAGWYYVKEDVTFNGLITSDGDVHIILGDNAKMSLKEGLYFCNNFSIYAQSTGTNVGTLEATPQDATAICVVKNITIAGGKITTNVNTTYSILSMDESIKIYDGHVIATSCDAPAIYAYKSVLINNGSVEASTSAQDISGIYAANGNIEINGGNVTAAGDARALESTSGTVKNNLPGTGWTNKEGTAGMASIPINTTGHDLSSYKKVQFPAVKANVKTAPTAKTLTFTGQAQELINSGVAENGTMQYAVNKDANTAPTSWSASIPKETEAGTYFVWYYAKGNSPYADSDYGKVEVIIKQAPVSYIDSDGKTKYCTDYTVVTESMSTRWNAGWYYVNDNVEFDSTINVNGDIHIILGDGKKLSVSTTVGDGIHTDSSYSLSIYAQSTGENMGTLEVTSQDSTAIFVDTILIAGGKIIAKANNKNSLGIFTFTGDIIINGGHIIATNNLGDAIFAGNNVFINNGNVEASASGDDSSGIFAIGNIEIKGGNVTATGNKQALWAYTTNVIKNHIPGTGWTDKEGTAGMASILISTTGHDLSSYKKVQFPAVKANVKTPPTAKTLSFTGQAQELINTGEAENGTMLYGLSKNENTEPITWGESIPTGIAAGTYFVWYYAKGITPDYDSAKDKIEVTIKEKDKPTQKKALEGDGQNISPGFPARFRFDVDYNDFIERGRVYVDGNPVDSKHYDADPGSTIITFKDEYIDSLSEGSHTVTVTLDDISVGLANFTVTKAKTPEDVLGAETEENQTPTTNEGAKSPATGDSISTVLLLFLISFMGLAGISLYTKRKNSLNK
ncbi:MAG: hypothetical protein E7241_03735 [Lachnospiraceae bacterium]|nr:hypothetical protein [Lachnospiraceae bacterium]